MTSIIENELVVNGIKYIRAAAKGPRYVVVLDRGWIFAGDVTDTDGRIRISNAVWVFSWDLVGFAAVIDDPIKAKADIRKILDVDAPKDTELFRIAVSDAWGV
jgi:hypothetical protein